MKKKHVAVITLMKLLIGEEKNIVGMEWTEMISDEAGAVVIIIFYY